MQVRGAGEANLALCVSAKQYRAMEPTSEYELMMDKEENADGVIAFGMNREGYQVRKTANS